MNKILINKVGKITQTNLPAQIGVHKRIINREREREKRTKKKVVFENEKQSIKQLFGYRVIKFSSLPNSDGNVPDTLELPLKNLQNQRN